MEKKIKMNKLIGKEPFVGEIVTWRKIKLKTVKPITWKEKTKAQLAMLRIAYGDKIPAEETALFF